MGFLIRVVVNAFAIWVVTLIPVLQVSVIAFPPGETLQFVITLLVVAVCLVPLAGLFAAMDAALQRVSKARVEEMRRDGVKRAAALEEVVAERARHVALLLLLRIVCEMVAAVLHELFENGRELSAEKVAARLPEHRSLLVEPVRLLMPVTVQLADYDRLLGSLFEEAAQ